MLSEQIIFATDYAYSDMKDESFYLNREDKARDRDRTS